jgi:hypothetical protein
MLQTSARSSASHSPRAKALQQLGNVKLRFHGLPSGDLGASALQEVQYNREVAIHLIGLDAAQTPDRQKIFRKVPIFLAEVKKSAVQTKIFCRSAILSGV